MWAHQNYHSHYSFQKIVHFLICSFAQQYIVYHEPACVQLMSAVGLQLPLHGVCGLQPMSNSTTPSKKTPSTPAATNAGNAPSALSTAAVKQSGSNRLFVKTLHCRHATRYGRWAGCSAAVSAGAQSAIPQPKGKVGAGVWVPSPQENYRQRHSHKRTAANGTATRGLPTKGQPQEDCRQRYSHKRNWERDAHQPSPP